MSDEIELTEDFQPLAIEGQLPLKAVGIENLKEANPKHMPPHRYLHPWFARRPTPASRLAILASILPEGVSSDELLQLIQIGPKELDTGIAQYVEEKKATESERSGTLGDHYGYPRPFTQSPNSTELETLHETLKERWDGELPTVLDPTAGGGVIPFESLRYELPTKANELNPVPSLMLKVLLEYAPAVGSLESDLDHWANKIHQRASENLSEFYPSSNPGQNPDIYVSSYRIECPECGGDIPLIPKWTIKSGSAVVKPSPNDDGTVTYECYTDLDHADLEGFDPNNGFVDKGGEANCPHCNVVTEGDVIREKFRNDEFEYEIYCVRYIDSAGGSGFRAPTEEDQEALKKAEERVKNDYELSTILSVERFDGHSDRAIPYGVTELRDLFSPRQLIAHYEYLQAFNHYKPQIQQEHTAEEAEAILSVISLACSKFIDRNARLADWDTSKGYPNPVFKGNILVFTRVFCDNNPLTGTMDFESLYEKVRDSYEELVSYLPEGSRPADVTTQDAAKIEFEEDIQAAIVDPPYYSSIMYSELADVFHGWLKEYLGDVYPYLFEGKLTNKEDEAVANPEKFEGVASGSNSKKQLANDFYEQKMSDIFSNLYEQLSPGGVMTVMFTHKETDAWDTLAKSLINSGFIITSTHPITSEMPQRANMRSSASADSTLLLTGRKPQTERDTGSAPPSLWSDVKTDTRKAAKQAARDLLESGVSLTKTDIIISAFGPTLRVFAEAHPVVDNDDNEVPPRRALEEAHEAVTQVLVNEYLEGEGIHDLDDVTKWYILCWLVHEKQTFSYDEGHQLGLGIGIDIDDLKRSTKTWRKSRGDIRLRGHADRVQNIQKKPEDRSSRIPVNPDNLSFTHALDAVHAAMHVYDIQGETACCDWLKERGFDADSTFKATLKALLQVLPHDHEDWELARDLAAGRTGDKVLNLDFSPSVFAEDPDDTTQTHIESY
jgi:adenine-specific DNA methylase